MIWSMPIQAYYLIRAGVSKDHTVRILANAWDRAAGNVNFYGKNAVGPYASAVGAYAIPSEWRTPAWPDGKPQLVRDAEIIAEHYAHDRPGIWAAYPYEALLAPGLIAAARKAVAEPVAGYTSPVAYAQATLNPALLNP